MRQTTGSATWVRRLAGLLKPTGRVNRTSYGVTCLGGVALAVIPAWVVVSRATDLAALGWPGLAAVALLLPLWLWIATSMKRLHDVGLSGAVMFFALTPLAGPAFIWIVCLLTPGETGPNVYGAEPRPWIRL